MFTWHTSMGMKLCLEAEPMRTQGRLGYCEDSEQQGIYDDKVREGGRDTEHGVNEARRRCLDTKYTFSG